jgi:hypothetical protein
MGRGTTRRVVEGRRGCSNPLRHSLRERHLPIASRWRGVTQRFYLNRVLNRSISENMAYIKIDSSHRLREWLSGQPPEVSQSIALRVALRALPFIAKSSKIWLESYALLPFGAVITSWIQLTESSIDIFKTGSRANARFGGSTFDFAGYRAERIAALAADASYHSAEAQTQSMHVLNDCVYAVGKAANAFREVFKQQVPKGYNLKPEGDEALWFSIEKDCNWLTSGSIKELEQGLSAGELWHQVVTQDWKSDLHTCRTELVAIDPNYSVWIDWYERRIRGERAAFDIPGDKGRVEDKKILRRLAEATDEDFWGKGHEYVNATLKGWLDEAREKVRPREVHALQAMDLSTGPPEVGRPMLEQVVPTPPQDPGAIAYGVNGEGKLDRLPNSDQIHLRDVADQRRAYNDLREAAAELLAEGQRLGHRLSRALDRFLQSLPNRFDDAEAYLVWRDANALRRLHRAHREAAKTPEPDEARLEPVIAEGLGGLLDLYNNFAFADDGLRAKDEARISPQERASGQAEAVAASPIVNAILATPEIATSEALDDIVADVGSTILSADDPYVDQVLDQSNKTKRNWIAALLAGAMETGGTPKLLGKRAAIGAATGVGTVVGTVVMKQILGFEYAVLIEFIATNAALLKDYAAIAFSAYPHLPELIDHIKLRWLKSGSK